MSEVDWEEEEGGRRRRRRGGEGWDAFKTRTHTSESGGKKKLDTQTINCFTD